MIVGSKGVRFLNLYESSERRESDVQLWDNDAGQPDGTYTFGARINVAVGTTVLTDTLVSDARDQSGKAKGESGWTGGNALPGVVAQGYLIAANRRFLDRYDLTGKYIDRCPCPTSVTLPNNTSAFGNLPWIHVGALETTSGGLTTAPFYLHASSAFSWPGPSNTSLVTLDGGATWASYTFPTYHRSGLPPQGWPYMTSWSGYPALFPT